MKNTVTNRRLLFCLQTLLVPEISSGRQIALLVMLSRLIGTGRQSKRLVMPDISQHLL